MDGSGCQAWDRPSCWPSIGTVDLQHVLQCIPSGQVKKVPNKGGFLFSNDHGKMQCCLSALYGRADLMIILLVSFFHENIKLSKFFF